MDVNHIVVVKRFEKVNNSLKQTKENNLQKNMYIYLESQISEKFVMKDYFQKEDVPQKELFQDLGLLIIKNNLPIQFVKSVWLKHLVLCLFPKLNFPFRK